MKLKLFLLILLIIMVVPQAVFARITPEDIVNAKKEAYEQKIKNYKPESKQKLEALSKRIVEINAKRTAELEELMVRQGEIIDEYQFRNGDKSTDAIEKARYWITYAHEAVAYQAAKIYVFELTSEGNLKSDAQATVNLFQNDLESSRQKVIKSQGILESVLP